MLTRSLPILGLSAGLALILTPSSADAQPAYASGLLHLPVGGTSSMNVSSDGRRLTACCIGSSGEDGVDVVLNSFYGGSVGVDYSVASALGSEIRIRPKGWDGTVKGNIRIAGNGDGTYSTEVDFTEMGAIAIRTLELDGLGQVISDVTTGGGIQGYLDNPICPPPGVPTFWKTSGGWWVWGCGVGLDPYGNNYPYPRGGDPVSSRTRQVMPILPDGTAGESDLELIEVLGTNTGDLSIFDAGLGTFGVNSWAVGQAHISEICPDPLACDAQHVALQCDNIGSSGEDGVELRIRAQDGGGVVVGAEELLAADGEIKVKIRGWDGTIKGSLRMTGDGSGAGTGTVEVDFTPLGATGVSLSLYDHLGHLTSVEDFPGSPNVNRPWVPNFTCPDGSTPVPMIRWLTFPGHSQPMLWIGWSCVGIGETEIYTYESGQARMAFSPIMPIGVPAPDAQVGGIVVSGNNLPEFTINALSVGVICRGDADGNGTADLDDLLVVLANFGQAPAGLSQGDFDGDGDVDLDDLLILLAVFGSGCV